jgi:succinoglycan biosynthesis protein ExoM
MTTPHRARSGAGTGRQGRPGDRLSPRAGTQHLVGAQRRARGSDARFLAFLDDDETAEAGWLTALWAPCREAGPRWCWAPSIRSIPTRARLDAAAAVHATRPVHVRGEIRTGYTCNVLIDRARPEIRALRFDPALGRSGGEDSDYFARVVLMGGRIAYAPDALVTEPVRPNGSAFPGWRSGATGWA